MTMATTATSTIPHDPEKKWSDEASMASPNTESYQPISIIEKVYNSEFKKAVAGTNLDPLGKTSLQLYFIVVVGFLNAVSSGFDGSLMSGINVMPQYMNFFHYASTGKSTGIVFMMYIVGNCVGSLFFAGPCTDLWGRRGGMFIGGFFILIGSAIITSAQNASAFLGGRFLLGFGISISTTAAPTWVTELAPPQWRGRLGAMYNSCFFVGSIPATGAMVGTAKLSSTWAWRLPLILQVVPPIIVMTCCWFCPESPRWLIQHGRRDEAEAILIKYHGGGEMNPIIELELKEFEESIASRQREPWWDYRYLISTPNSRWRLLCLTLMCVNGQLAGNGLITYFLPVIFQNAGVKSTHTQLVYNFANSILSAFGAFCGAALTDRIGRRRRLYIGAAVLAVLLAMVAALSSKYGQKGNTNKQGANASIAIIFVFGITYSFVYTPLQALYCAEVMTTQSRAKGMAIHILISNCAGFINTFANSVGLANLGWKYYFVFVGWNVCASVLWYLFCVETRGRTLEELDEVFDMPWPARASRKRVEVEVPMKA